MTSFGLQMGCALSTQNTGRNSGQLGFFRVKQSKTMLKHHRFGVVQVAKVTEKSRLRCAPCACCSCGCALLPDRSSLPPRVHEPLTGTDGRPFSRRSRVWCADRGRPTHPHQLLSLSLSRGFLVPLGFDVRWRRSGVLCRCERQHVPGCGRETREAGGELAWGIGGPCERRTREPACAACCAWKRVVGWPGG